MKNGDETAFPYEEQDRCGNPIARYSGLSKREYFAAAAMQAILSEEKTARRIGHQEDGIGTMARAAALMATECADALLEALAQESPAGNIKK